MSYLKNSKGRRKHRERRRTRRLSILQFLGGVCKSCGFSDYRALQIDHVNGGGRTERKRLGSEGRFFAEIRNKPNNYQVLCANCNWIKKYERQETKSFVD